MESKHVSRMLGCLPIHQDVQLCLPYTNPKLQVSCLIDQTTKQWDEQMIYDLIAQEDHHLIYKIYLSPLQPDDQRIWPYTRNGIFTGNLDIISSIIQ